MLEEVSIDLPAQSADISSLKLGSVVYLNGVVYTASENLRYWQRLGPRARLRP